jgi:hypothetical protein
MFDLNANEQTNKQTDKINDKKINARARLGAPQRRTRNRTQPHFARVITFTIYIEEDEEVYPSEIFNHFPYTGIPRKGIRIKFIADASSPESDMV